MYYPKAQKIRILTYRNFSALLIISITALIFPLHAFAGIKNKTAEEYRVRGYDEQQKGNFEQALVFYTKSLELVSDNAAAWNDIGVLYEQLGIETKAEAGYLKAIRLNPKYLPPYTNLAYFYQKKGNIAQAVEYFEKRSLQGGPKDPWAEKAKAELLKIDPERQKRIIQEESERLAQELIQKARDEFAVQIARAEGHYQEGLALWDEKDYTAALEEFTAALSLTPQNPKILRAREEVLEDKMKDQIYRQTDQALEMLEEGDFYSARDEFRKVLTLIPSEPIQKSE